MSPISSFAFILPFCVAALSFAQTSPAPSHPRLRVGVAGVVHGHVDGFFKYSGKSPEIEIVGIAEPNAQLLAQAGKNFGFDRSQLYSSLEEMIAKARPQAVLAYTNTYDHRKVVEICARHGVHVMMEKPLAVSFEDALAMQKAAQEGHIHVLVNYETSWYPSNHAAHDLVREGALGDIRKVVVHDGHKGPREIGVEPEFLAWLTDPKLNGAGALFDFGCYGADLMTWLMNGEAPQSVTAVTQQIKPDIYPRVDDEATIVLTYPKAQAIIQASWNWPFDRKDMEVYGATGYAITVKRDDIRVRRAGDSQETQMAAKPIPAPYDDSMAYLRAVVLDGAEVEPLSSLETNVIVTEILDAARRSAKEGRTVRLPLGR
ncbi:MAG TPA: Gfo/Idh/MocA family oxidoreductase [Candidatus Sulfotelmatobacter sp.]|nr:Gfo/Idh/MocA family oxidoreductase [Candidatus Sulfotelmatobacter sp.]